MGIVSDIFKSDAAAFVNTDEEAEPATYFPAGNRSAGRAISVYMMRPQPRPQNETHNMTMVDEVRIEVINDSTLGIASTELNTGKDLIDLPRWPGDTTPKTYRVHERERVDGAMMLLRCR